VAVRARLPSTDIRVEHARVRLVDGVYARRSCSQGAVAELHYASSSVIPAYKSSSVKVSASAPMSTS
jgi:hypothetical protein